MTKISIIIPTYEEEKAIEQTLRQFEAHKDICEVIVSDGGSKDRTVQRAELLADKVVTHTDTSRQNIAQGRNAGAGSTNGDILVFLDADVHIADMNIFLEEVRSLRQRKQHYMAIRILVSPDSARMRDKVFHAWLNAHARLCALVGHGWARGECQVFERDFFEAIGGYDPSLTASEDYEICLRAMKKSRMYYSKRCIGYESGRRYRSYGYPKTLWLWIRNAWEVSTKKRSYSPEWEPIR